MAATTRPIMEPVIEAITTLTGMNHLQNWNVKRAALILIVSSYDETLSFIVCHTFLFLEIFSD